MRKLVTGVVAAAALMFAGAAQAEPLVYVGDPTPGGTFSGEYQCGWETYQDEQNVTQYKLDADGKKIPVYCHQEGHVAVYSDGVEACNGNPELARPDNGEPLQGYVWVGPGHAATGTTTASAPGGVAGAGHNNAPPEGAPGDTSPSPCP
jgi:hypothetical protein